MVTFQLVYRAPAPCRPPRMPPRMHFVCYLLYASASWGLLGPSWGLLGPSWASLGSPKVLPKFSQAGTLRFDECLKKVVQIRRTVALRTTLGANSLGKVEGQVTVCRPAWQIFAAASQLSPPPKRPQLLSCYWKCSDR